MDENEHYRCFFCNGVVIHQGSDMAQDVYPDACGADDILHYMCCSECGAEYEIIQKAENNGDTPMKDELLLRKQLLKDD